MAGALTKTGYSRRAPRPAFVERAEEMLDGDRRIRIGGRQVNDWRARGPCSGSQPRVLVDHSPISATSLSDASLAFQIQRLAEVSRAAVVVEGEYPDLFRTQPGRGAWLADMLGRLAARYPEVPVIFAGSRKFAEEWTYRFFGAAIEDSVMHAQPVEPAPPEDR